jgi:TolB-like protein/Flp pilus assembly protein TadD
MPNDIFISYSSHDRERARQLALDIQGLGYSVWMDVFEIEPSTRWSTEIAEAINVCRILALLLSKASLASENVVKELTLAAEKKKHILPITLEQMELSPDFEYHLAGLQHTSADNLKAIARALEHLAKDTPMQSKKEERPKEKQSEIRKRIAVLPFDDFSPSRDSDWFSDGLASELTNKLSRISKLSVIDRLTARQYKNSRLASGQIASELGVRYLLCGAVRKSGERIRVDVSLVDADRRATLWDDSYPGKMEDIFEIQDEVASKIASSLEIILTREERASVRERSTKNAEAYELGMRGVSYHNRNTREGYLYALSLLEKAIALDPGYTWAYATLAGCVLNIYAIYDHDPAWLHKAQDAIDKALALKPNDQTALSALAILKMRSGLGDEAVEIAKRAVEADPANEIAHFQLGYVYDGIGDYAAAASAYSRSLELAPASLDTLYNLILDLDLLHKTEERNRICEKALPLFERYVARNPDDQNKRQRYASTLYYLGRKEECFREIEALLALPALDPKIYYNTACRYAFEGNKTRALELLAKAVDGGYHDIHQIMRDPDLESLRGTPEFDAIIAQTNG